MSTGRKRTQTQEPVCRDQAQKLQRSGPAKTSLPSQANSADQHGHIRGPAAERRASVPESLASQTANLWMLRPRPTPGQARGRRERESTARRRWGSLGPAPKQLRRQGTSSLDGQRPPECPPQQTVPWEPGACVTTNMLSQTTAEAAICPKSFLAGGRRPCHYPWKSTPATQGLIQTGVSPGTRPIPVEGMEQVLPQPLRLDFGLFPLEVSEGPPQQWGDMSQGGLGLICFFGTPEPGRRNL